MKPSHTLLIVITCLVIRPLHIFPTAFFDDYTKLIIERSTKRLNTIILIYFRRQVKCVQS